MVEYGDTELKESYARVCRNLVQFYEYEDHGRWGTDHQKKDDLLSMLIDICRCIDSLEH